MEEDKSFLPQANNYRTLKAFQKAECIYDVTYYFVHTFLKPSDRTSDQMIQAARSGKQNIAEGSEASTTSRETEIKLTNVAKASLEELLIDYEDYLRQHQLSQWTATHPRYQPMREYARSNKIETEYTLLMGKLDDEELANLCITLINQATYMLRRLIEKQQQQFLLEGGIREQMTRARLNQRNNKSNPSDKSDPSDPSD